MANHAPGLELSRVTRPRDSQGCSVVTGIRLRRCCPSCCVSQAGTWPQGSGRRQCCCPQAAVLCPMRLPSETSGNLFPVGKKQSGRARQVTGGRNKARPCAGSHCVFVVSVKTGGQQPRAPAPTVQPEHQPLQVSCVLLHWLSDSRVAGNVEWQAMSTPAPEGLEGSGEEATTQQGPACGPRPADHPRPASDARRGPGRTCQDCTQTGPRRGQSQLARDSAKWGLSLPVPTMALHFLPA